MTVREALDQGYQFHPARMWHTPPRVGDTVRGIKNLPYDPESTTFPMQSSVLVTITSEAERGELIAAMNGTIQLGIGQAVKEMRDGRRVARAGWNGKGMWLAIQLPDENSKMTEPYVYMKTAQGGMIPWLASQADLLAVDWEVVCG